MSLFLVICLDFQAEPSTVTYAGIESSTLTSHHLELISPVAPDDESGGSFKLDGQIYNAGDSVIIHQLSQDKRMIAKITRITHAEVC